MSNSASMSSADFDGPLRVLLIASTTADLRPIRNAMIASLCSSSDSVPAIAFCRHAAILFCNSGLISVDILSSVDFRGEVFPNSIADELLISTLGDTALDGGKEIKVELASKILGDRGGQLDGSKDVRVPQNFVLSVRIHHTPLCTYVNKALS